jgi:hypothetical protein
MHNAFTLREPQGISPATPGVARIKIARSTLAPHQSVTLHAAEQNKKNKFIFDVEWIRVSFAIGKTMRLPFTAAAKNAGLNDSVLSARG